MSNYSYLEGVNTRTAYPRQSKKDGKGYETIVCDVYCVPLLFMRRARPGRSRCRDRTRSTRGSR